MRYFGIARVVLLFLEKHEIAILVDAMCARVLVGCNRGHLLFFFRRIPNIAAKHKANI